MPEPHTSSSIRRARLVSLLLDGPRERTPLEVVQWFGAMQAQDVASGHWSLGVRCAGATEADVLAAFERRALVRTWPMRGTIHLVAAEDVGWLLALTGVRALSGSVRRREQLGLSDADADRAVAALDTALAGGKVLSRAQALAAIVDAGVDTSGQRGYHLLWYAAQTGVVCIGPQRGTDQTFVRLDDWAPQQRAFSREDSLVELLLRYVRGHGPVGLRDFAGWSGLTLKDARAAAAGNAGRLVPLTDDTEALWATCELADRLRGDDIDPGPVVALPGFDELILGYKDRGLHVPDGAMDAVVPGGNGMFRSTLVSDGVVAATWTRTLRSKRVHVTVEPLRPLTTHESAAARRSLEQYAAFLGRELRLTTTGD
jgi:hypothetical protein